MKVSQQDHAARGLQSLSRQASGRSYDNNLPQDLLQVLGQEHKLVEGHHLDSGERRRIMDYVESTALSPVKMLDSNTQTDLTINETYENSFLIIHWSSIVIYSSIIAIILFLLIVWRLTKAKWLRKFLAKKCRCSEDESNNVEMQTVEKTIYLADALHQIESKMPGTQATSRATNRSLTDRWTIRENEIKSFNELQKKVEEERKLLEQPIA